MVSDSCSFCSVSANDHIPNSRKGALYHSKTYEHQLTNLHRPEFPTTNKNTDYEKKKPQRYTYFPNASNRATGDLKMNYTPNGKQRYSQNWQLEMSENQRLRMILRSLGKAAEKYVASSLHQNNYQHRSHREKKCAFLDNIDETNRNNLCNPSNNISSILHYPNPYYIVQEITEKEPLRHIIVENNSTAKEKSIKEDKIIPKREEDENNEINDFEALPNTVKNGSLKPLLHEYMKLKIEKQRLQRRLGFLLEDISIDSKKRGFSRPNQYLHHLSA